MRIAKVITNKPEGGFDVHHVDVFTSPIRLEVAAARPAKLWVRGYHDELIGIYRAASAPAPAATGDVG